MRVLCNSSADGRRMIAWWHWRCARFSKLLQTGVDTNIHEKKKETPFLFDWTLLNLRGVDATGRWKHFFEICFTHNHKIASLHIHDSNLHFHYITKVLYWTEVWWGFWSSVNSLSRLRNQTIWVSFVTWLIILSENEQTVVRKWWKRTVTTLS